MRTVDRAGSEPMVPERKIYPNGLYVSDEEWAEIQARLPPTDSQIDEWCRRTHPSPWWTTPALWAALFVLGHLMFWGLYKLVRFIVTSLWSWLNSGALPL